MVDTHLLAYLAAVPDPRAARGRRHPLVAILAMAAAAAWPALTPWPRSASPYAAQVIQVTRKTAHPAVANRDRHTIPTIDRRPSAVLSAFSQVVRHHK
jgi:hypothetical protein